jgi:D-lactate dehydrogenase
MKLIYFGQEAWEEQYIKTKLPGVAVVFTLGTLQDATGGDAEAEVLSIFVNSHVGAAEMDKYPKLRLIATRSTGFDHIDVAEAKKRGIAIASVPSYGVNTVAEFAFALILALSRRMCEASARVHTGSFSQAGLTGFDLQGKTLGIVGCGHIGVHSANIGSGFGMQVLVFDVHHDEALAQSCNFTYVSLEELLAQSDIITIHVPYMPQTHHLINQKNISLIKKGAYLINTARGAIVETEALVAALKEGILAGAGLDVLEEEGDMNDELKLLTGPHPQEEEMKVVLENHYLMTHPRVIITPHVAFDTNEAIRRMLDTTIENIAAYTNGGQKNIVAL